MVRAGHDARASVLRRGERLRATTREIAAALIAEIRSSAAPSAPLPRARSAFDEAREFAGRPPWRVSNDVPLAPSVEIAVHLRGEGRSRWGRGPLRRTLGRDRGDRAADHALTIPTPARACTAWHVGDDGSLAVLLIGPPAVSLPHSLETPKMRPKRRGQSCLRDCETTRIAGGFASASPTLGRLWEREVVGSNPTAPTASGPRVSVGARSAPSTSARRRPRLAAPFARRGVSI